VTPTPDHTFTATQIIAEALASRVPDGLEMHASQVTPSVLATRLPLPGNLKVFTSQVVVMVLASRTGPTEDLQYGLPLVGVMR